MINISRLRNLALLASIGLLVAVLGLPAGADAQTGDCGKVHGAHVRSTKGQVTRSRCRAVAANGIDAINSGHCGQWNNPNQPSFCTVGAWRCGWPTAGTQIRNNLTYFCMVPKDQGAYSEAYRPAHYKKIIKIG